MRKAKIGLLVALLGGLAVVTLINEIGVSHSPSAGLFPDGAVRGFYPSDVRSCMGARALAALGDRTSQWHWHHCAKTLVHSRASASFDLRYWSLILGGALKRRPLPRYATVFCEMLAEHVREVFPITQPRGLIGHLSCLLGVLVA